MKEKCKICEKEFGLKGLGSHVVQTHKMNMQDYLELYYNFPKSVVEWKSVSLKDVLFAQQLLKENSQFDNYLDLFQYLYNQYKDYKKLNEKYGLDVGKICICLGVKIDRSLSDEHKKNVSKGRMGQKLSDEHKQRIREGYYAIPEEERKATGKKISEKLKGHRHSRESIEKMIKNRTNPAKPFRGKAGKRKDLDNTYFRSTWEANFARVLKLMKVDYEFEPKIFWLKRNDGSEISYTPDFYLPKTDEYIEVKGYWMDDAKEKFELFKEQYPEIKIKVIDSNNYKAYENRFKDQIKECNQ